MAADFAAYHIDNIAFAGAQHDLVAALVFCQSINVDLCVINGKIVVADGQLMTTDLPILVEQHNTFSKQLVDGQH